MATRANTGIPGTRGREEETVRTLLVVVSSHDHGDNCLRQANADQADLDRDGLGNVCDPDGDGDGDGNAKGEAHGTGPRNAAWYPRKITTGA